MQPTKAFPRGASVLMHRIFPNEPVTAGQRKSALSSPRVSRCLTTSELSTVVGVVVDRCDHPCEGRGGRREMCVCVCVCVRAR
jgi:hypothetical protein